MATKYPNPQKVPAATAGQPTPKLAMKKDWTPMDGPSLSDAEPLETKGIKTRGNGAAQRGITARGPMA